MVINNSFIIIDNESWFIPFDILKIIGTIFAIILAIIFLFIIIFDKTCHTVPMLLVANSCLSELIFASIMFAMTLFTFQNDFKQIYFYNSLCIFQGYLSYVGYALQNYCFVLQAIYRYMIVVYPTYLFCQSIKFQCLLICLTWIFCFIYCIPFILTGQIKYNVDNQVCQMPLGLSFFGIYTALCIYGIPMSLIIFIYFKLVRYVKEMSKRITPTNILSRAVRELKMVQHIVILIAILFTIGFPYAIFSVMAFFISPPKYYARIAFIFVDVTLPLILIILFVFTEPLKTSVMKRFNARSNLVVSAIIL